jgi:hypothetical protein
VLAGIPHVSAGHCGNNNATMGERKVLNKYYPPDFDPSKLEKIRLGRPKQQEIRMMLPFSMQCNACGEFMYRGKKFNSRKEDADGVTYKGLKEFRFYIKCIACSSEITFLTDLEHADYKMESGATRNFEIWRAQDEDQKKAENDRAEAEKGDAMKALEHRTIDSKIEMDVMDQLDELRALSKAHSKVSPDDALAALARGGAVGSNSVAGGGASAGGSAAAAATTSASGSASVTKAAAAADDDDDEEAQLAAFRAQKSELGGAAAGGSAAAAATLPDSDSDDGGYAGSALFSARPPPAPLVVAAPAPPPPVAAPAFVVKLKPKRKAEDAAGGDAGKRSKP